MCSCHWNVNSVAFKKVLFPLAPGARRQVKVLGQKFPNFLGCRALNVSVIIIFFFTGAPGQMKYQ